MTETIPARQSTHQRRSRGAILAFALACAGVGFYLAAPAIGRVAGMAPSEPPWWMGWLIHPGGLVWVEARPQEPGGPLFVRVSADNRLDQDWTLDFTNARLTLYGGKVFRPIGPVPPLRVASGETAEAWIVFPPEAGNGFRRLYSVRMSMEDHAWNFQGRLYRDRETMIAALKEVGDRASAP